MVIEFNKEECEKYYDLKYIEGDIIEIRAIDLSKVNPPVERFAKNREQFVKICETLNAIEHLQVYAGHNPRTMEGRDALSVKSISHICLDCDPVRKKGFEKKAATEREIELCEIEVDKIIDACPKIGLKKPIKIFTGNGFALNWKIKTIEITDENRKEVEDKIKAFTKEMQRNYNSNNMKIDQTGDLPRIYKPAGVMSKKGDDTEDRPFRMAEFIGYSQVDECEKLKEYVLNIKIKKDKFEIKEQSGEVDESRSATEYREIIRQIGKGKTKEEVYNYMNAFAKWISSPEAYKTMTYEKAFGYIENQRRILESSELTIEAKVKTLLLDKKKTLATEEIVNYIKDNNYIYTTRDDLKSEMWIYNEGIYIPQGRSFVKEISRRILGDNFTTHLYNSILTKIEADTQIDQDDFFNVNYLDEVPVENGILNIHTKEINDFDHNKIFFNKVPITFNIDSKCPNILDHFKSILKNQEDIDVIIEIFGYLLLKEYKIEKAFMFVGGGRNGKSKTIELMKRFLGISNCSSVPLRSLNDDSFSLHELFGKMANLAADLSKTDLKETGMIKSLIGRDGISAKRKFLRELNFVNYAKMIFAANELPRIYDTTDGFWTKWILIEFPNRFVTQKDYNELKDNEKEKCRIMNPDIIENITSEEEMSGLLNLALESLKNILKNKDFSYSKNVHEVKDMWIRQSDSFTAFCYDHLLEDYECNITKKDLRRCFHKYCKKHKVSGMSDKAIKITLENMYGVYDSQNKDYDRIWEGIRLKDKSKLEY